MSYYSKPEQETLYLYDVAAGHWRVYSTYPPHIRQLIERAAIHRTEVDDEGRIIAVEGIADRNQVRLFKPLISKE
ncbi:MULTISPECIES: hypothetical protein [Siminovitchia]|uniref:DUF2283 domain-containing protein n=1 Tax=Siminovitchia thermophila TaxID=1245522 RepID=A0ABS2RBR7_9BACI|nr:MULTISPECIES: hypothetical protein [Siminovitchia]MBM7717100.1 hypothetical protein [Siminovitchia thermophila]